MTAFSVDFDGTRVNSSDSNTSWGNFGSSGGSPASESPIAYQNALAVNKKINSSSLGGIDYDPGSGALDMTAAANRLWFVKAIASDSFDLNLTYGMAIGVGSANNAYYLYNVAGSGSNLSVYNSYPVQGGYLITAIDPNIAAWRESTTGSPSLTAVDWFGVQCAFIVGAAKAENVALDAIDVGTGLSLTGGTGADPRANYKSFYEIDQDVLTNRWGAAIGKGDAVILRGMHNIGDGVSGVGFDDTTSVVTFPDGYHSAGLFGVTVNLDIAGDDVNDGALLISEGTRNGVDANDTRADYIVTGATDNATLSHQLRNFRNVTYNANTVADGVNIECQLLTQDSAEIKNSIVKTNALTSVACLQDPTFGTTSGLHDTQFIQSGAGHAIEIGAAGTYSLTGLTFTGYGAIASDSAAIDITATSGTVTINIGGGGNTPTYKTAGATVVIANTVTVRVIVQNESLVAIENARVLVEAAAGGDLIAGDDILAGLTNASGVLEDAGFNYTNPQPITGRVRKASGSPYYKTAPITGTIQSSGFETTLIMTLDE